MICATSLLFSGAYVKGGKVVRLSSKKSKDNDMGDPGGLIDDSSEQSSHLPEFVEKW